MRSLSRRASSRRPVCTAANRAACTSAVTLPIPEMHPSAPSRKLAISDMVNEDMTATGRPVARTARRFFS